MNYYLLETLIRERIEAVERLSRLAWVFGAARANIDNSPRSVSARRRFVWRPVGRLFRDQLTRRYV